MALPKNHECNYCPKCDGYHELNYDCVGIKDVEMKDYSKTYRIVGIDRALAPSVFEIEVWNKAIEAAACLIENTSVGSMDSFYIHDCKEHAEEIRRLKK